VGTAQPITPTTPTTPQATEVSGTPTERPTPPGPSPTPENLLNIFQLFPSNATLVKRDWLQLDKDDTLEVLFTITGPGESITTENRSAIGVADYDPKYREWNLAWSTSLTVISGTASPLPSANRVDGYNGGDLLRTGAPIFLLRATTLDSHAHLYMWKWDAEKHQANFLKMVPASGGSEQDAAFEGDLDVNVADLDNDWVYEVIADNLKDVQVWKWDGSKYAPEAKR
jgi:hypothetical protein